MRESQWCDPTNELTNDEIVYECYTVEKCTFKDWELTCGFDDFGDYAIALAILGAAIVIAIARIFE